MSKFWNFVRNESEPGSPRTLFLSGEISDETWWGDEVTPAMFRSELESGSGDIDVWINSPGGDVFAAAQIYNMLRDYKGNVNVKIDSLAASAASVIAMAGDNVAISPVGMIMIHDPMMLAVGNTRDMEQAIAVLNEVKQAILTAYTTKTHLSRNKVSELMSNETWLSAKKAKDLGFVDEILFTNAKEAGPAEPEDTEALEDAVKDEVKPKAELTYHPISDVLFSRKACEDSFLNKVTEGKPEGIPISNLDKRLNLLSH